ncbi:MAG TPA: hypothetical protein VM822_02365 [Pseudolabrys sp.]|nr:hypothetical protein [Pseudolabrys sp.]
MTGELSAAEAHHMVMEKQSAAMQAHVAYTESILNGEAASAPGAYFDVYHRAVQSNRRRLSSRRWRWPWLR